MPEEIVCLYCNTTSKRMRSYIKHHNSKHKGELCKAKVNGKFCEGIFPDLKNFRLSSTPRAALPSLCPDVRGLHTTIDPKLLNTLHNTREPPGPIDFSPSTNPSAFYLPQECPVSGDSDSDMASNNSDYWG